MNSVVAFSIELALVFLVPLADDLVEELGADASLVPLYSPSTLKVNKHTISNAD